MEETKKLAKFINKLSFDKLPENVIERAKDIILDQLGVQLIASTMPWSQMVYEYVKGQGGTKESTIVNYGDKATVEGAAFANSTFGNGFELDDWHPKYYVHPGGIVVPAALAVGEKERISGKDLITAVVAGYEVMGRIAASVNPSCKGRGFHSTSVVGPFAAAAIAGKIRGFDDDKMLNALSIAGSSCSGLTEYQQAGGSVKRIHGALAAQSGLRAATLAGGGLTGPASILEGAKGFCQAYSNKFDLNAINDPAAEYTVLTSAYKRHSCCGGSHAAIDAMLKITGEHKFTPEDISEIVMGTSKMITETVGVIKEPKNITDSQFSAYFALALVLLKGSASFRYFTEASLKDPGIIALSKKVKVVVDDEMQGVFNQTGEPSSKVTVKLKNGAAYTVRVDHPKGTPENTLTKPELQAKFRELATMVISEERAETVIKKIDKLDQMRNVADLFPLVTR